MNNAASQWRKHAEHLTKLKHIKLLFILVLVVLLASSYFFSFQTKTIFVQLTTWPAIIFGPNLTTNSSNTTQNNPKLALLNRTHRLFCLILATPNAYQSNTALVVLSAWVHKCDNYRFVTKLPTRLQARPINVNINKTDHGADSFGNEIEEPLNILHPSGLFVDQYLKLTFKMYYAIREIYLKYWMEGYDWYLKADLDTFINVNNLREFLQVKNPDSPITFGYDFRVIIDGGYHSGGAGYVLSKEAFRRVGYALSQNLTNCPLGEYEDTDLHSCLRTLGVKISKSIDHRGRERFHPNDLVASFTYNSSSDDGWAANPVRGGEECCSDNWVSFHRINQEHMIRLASIVDRHQVLTSLEGGNQTNKTKPTFRQIYDEYINIDNVQNAMNEFVNSEKMDKK